jgi:hypothetical protein
MDWFKAIIEKYLNEEKNTTKAGLAYIITDLYIKTLNEVD